MIRYKLTDENMRTHNGFQWEIGKEYVIESEGGALCTNAYFHFYCHPLLAVLHNPIHAGYFNPRLFEAEVSGECLTEGQMKEGWKKALLIKEIPLPEITIEQRTKYGIYCALEVYKEESFINWANNWLKGNDRTSKSANTANAANAANAAAYAAANTANAANAAYAAYAAANAAINLIEIAIKAVKGS